MSVPSPKSAAIALLLLASGFLAHSPAWPSIIGSDELPTLANVVKRVEYGIVNIFSQAGGNFGVDGLDQDHFEFFRRFFDMPEYGPNRRRGQSLGSGVIIDPEKGYILTNDHLLVGADSVSVRMADGRVFVADVVGTDKEMDVGLLQIEADGLVGLNIGDSDRLEVGDFVLALGSPFGLSATVTSGIVSALGRSGLGLDTYENFIQTDAAINPGSSGGALVNLRGELIGINTAILAPSGGSVGIGFAIPINAAMSVVRQIEQYGAVHRGLFGIRFQALTPELAEVFQLSTLKGVIVNDVEPDSAAAQSGLQAGDVLTHIDGVEIVDGNHLRNMIALIRVGEEARVTYARNGEVMHGRGVIQRKGRTRVAGEQIDPRLEGYDFATNDEGRPGVIVLDAQADPFFRFGLREDDVIVAVSKQAVKNVDDFVRIVQETGKGRQAILLTVVRDGENIFLVLG